MGCGEVFIFDLEGESLALWAEWPLSASTRVDPIRRLTRSRLAPR